MIKIRVFDLRNEKFKREEFVVDTNNHKDAMVAYALEKKILPTMVVARSACTMDDYTVLDFKSVSKHHIRNLTQL